MTDRNRRSRTTTAKATIRRVPPEPPRYRIPTPNPDANDVDVPDESRIARRRQSSAPAHEVQMADLEILGFEPATPAPGVTAFARPTMPSLPPPLVKRPPMLSAPPAPPPVVAPALPESAPFEVPTLVIPPRRSRGPILALMGAAMLAGGFALGMAARGAGMHGAPAPMAATVAPAAKATEPPVPVVEVTSLPKAADGTIVGAAGHRLWIDGKLAEDWKAVVACGMHAVQVGSAGVLRKVEVPCGDEIVVPP